MLENLREQDRISFLMSVLACIGDGTIVTDKKGNILYMNTIAEDLTGWKSEEATGMAFDIVFPLVHYYTGEKLEGPVNKVLRTGKQAGLQNHSALITKDANKFFVSATCSPLLDQGAKTNGVVLSFRNVDRFKNIEEGIRREKNNLHNVLEALPTGTMVVQKDFTVSWANKPLLGLFQTKEENFVGRHFGEGFCCIFSGQEGCGKGNSSICELAKNIREVFEEGKSRKDIVAEHQFIRDGEQITLWLKTSLIPLDSSDDTRVLVVMEDITEQRQYEAALRKSRDEAASASRVKSEFIANMSHEIRTPLNGLIGMLDLILQMDLDKEQMEYAFMAKSSANNLLKVINDILDFSAIEAGKVKVRNNVFSLQDLLDEIVKWHEILVHKKGLVLGYTHTSELPPFVTGDPDRLKQILNNLIGNAIKFTETGRIDIGVKTAAKTENSVELVFSVTDTGIGISEDKMNLLFKRFSQVDGSLTRRYNGAGLGLAISKQLAELMGGTIDVQSKIGVGSTFIVKIPFTLYDGEHVRGNNRINEQDDPWSDIFVENGGAFRLNPLQRETNGPAFDFNNEEARTVILPTVQANKERKKLNDFGMALEKAIIEKDYQRIGALSGDIKKAAFLMDINDVAELAFQTEHAAVQDDQTDMLSHAFKLAEAIRHMDKEG